MGHAERPIQDVCMEYLGMHPQVAFVHTTTTGTLPLSAGGKKRYIKVGYPGMGDIVGMLKDGRFLSVETKEPGKVPTEDQYDFMDMVNKSGGIACWVDSLDILELICKDKIKGLNNESQ